MKIGLFCWGLYFVPATIPNAPEVKTAILQVFIPPEHYSYYDQEYKCYYH